MFTLSAKKHKTWSLIATGTDSSQTLAGRLERLPTVRVLTNLVQTGEGFRERKSLKKRTTAAAQCTIYMGQSMTLMPCTCRFSHAHASRAFLNTTVLSLHPKIHVNGGLVGLWHLYVSSYQMFTACVHSVAPGNTKVVEAKRS